MGNGASAPAPAPAKERETREPEPVQEEEEEIPPMEEEEEPHYDEMGRSRSPSVHLSEPEQEDDDFNVEQFLASEGYMDDSASNKFSRETERKRVDEHLEDFRNRVASSPDNKKSSYAALKQHVSKKKTGGPGNETGAVHLIGTHQPTEEERRAMGIMGNVRTAISLVSAHAPESLSKTQVALRQRAYKEEKIAQRKAAQLGNASPEPEQVRRPHRIKPLNEGRPRAKVSDHLLRAKTGELTLPPAVREPQRTKIVHGVYDKTPIRLDDDNDVAVKDSRKVTPASGRSDLPPEAVYFEEEDLYQLPSSEPRRYQDEMPVLSNGRRRNSGGSLDGGRVSRASGAASPEASAPGRASPSKGKPAPKGGKKGAPAPMLTCYSCCNEYSGTTLSGHLKKCIADRVAEMTTLPSDMRPRPPSPPTLSMPREGASKDDVDTYNVQAAIQYEDHMPQCPYCGGRFDHADELLEHVDQCDAADQGNDDRRGDRRQANGHANGNGNDAKKSGRGAGGGGAKGGAGKGRSQTGMPPSFKEGRTSPPAAAPAPAPAPAAAKGPKRHIGMLTCYCCNREYSASSLPRHLRECPGDRADELKMLPPELHPGVTPPLELPVPTETSTKAEVEAYNLAAKERFKDYSPQCPTCGRHFEPDSLLVHIKGCKAKDADHDGVPDEPKFAIRSKGAAGGGAVSGGRKSRNA